VRNKITIATRASNLALWQAEYIKSQIESNFSDTIVELNKITSRGDKILDRPLALVGGKGHFTKELEDEMLAGNADLAVHSLKDVPTYMPDGLELISITTRADQSDVLLSHKYKDFESLPQGAIVGTTSLRRRMQLLKQRPDLTIKDLRGNVNTRLRKLADGDYDAIVLAYVGLDRLNLLSDIPYKHKLEFMIPPMGQASLGIQIVSNNSLAKSIAATLNDTDSQICATLERDFVSAIEAGCSAPVAVNATINNGKLKMVAMIGYPDGTHILQESLEAELDKSQELGNKLARIMIDQGALDILSKAEEIAFKEEMPQRL